MGEWIKKMWFMYTWSIIGLEKGEILLFVTMQMKLQGLMLSETSDWEKQYYMLSLIFET